jgi:FixJ family two-component response regulator
MSKEENTTIFIVDDDKQVTTALARLVRTAGYEVESYSAVQDFLDRYRAEVPGCIILDVALGDWNGLDIQRRLNGQGLKHPIIFISGASELYTSVQAMKAGAVDFLVKPIDADNLFQAIHTALERDMEGRQEFHERTNVRQHLAHLTPREYEVLSLVVRGKLNKQIAYELGIVEKTAKVHRGRVMSKMGARNLAELVRMAEQAGIVPTMVKKATDVH